MNILNSFTFRSLKLNKKRTIVTIIGIILSTALICATAGLLTSMQQTLINDAIKSDGDYHAGFLEVPKEEQKYITENRNVSSYMVTQNVGYSRLEESKNEYKPYVYLKEYEKTALNNLGLNLVEGKVPENSNELLISEHINSNGSANWKVGDKVTLKVGKRYLDGYELNQNNPCYDTEEGETRNNTEKENIEVEFEKEYTIVGIMSRPSYNEEGYDSPGYTVISYLDSIRDKANIYVKYTNIKNTYKYTNLINGLEENAKTNDEAAKYEVSFNESLLNYSGVTKNDSTTQMLYIVGGIVICIIIGTSIFVIRNSFHISITEKYKQYGILASVGATSKQIKHNVLYEGFLIGLVAIPLGILSGIFATWVLMMLLNIILNDFIDVIFICKVPISAILVSVVMSIITIYLSCLLPARKAAKISPIEAIRSNNDIKIKAKKLKMPKFIKSLFGIAGEISWKNLKRSKKKYRTTVISIFVSIVVFLSLSSVIDYGFKLSGIYYEDLDYNVTVYSTSADNVVSFDDIVKLENIERYNIIKKANATINFKYTNKDCLYYSGNEDEDYKIGILIISLSNNEYDRYLKENKLDKEEYKNKAILLDKIEYYINDEYYESNQLNVKEGDIIEAEIRKYNRDTINVTEVKNISIQVGKRLEAEPMGVNVSAPILIVNEELMEQIGEYRQNSMYIQSSNAYKLEDDIQEMNKETIRWEVYNREEDKRENDAIILIISIFLYGFIAVITLIGVTNIFNTITTNMALRSKEFAMLKSIGMTSKEFNKMIRLESIFYGAKSLILGIPVGLLLSYLIYNTIADKYHIEYMFPYLQIVLCVLFVFVIVFITMKYSLSKINKQNIIETIRNENV